MIKTGKVEPGKTPSVVSGKKSTRVCEGEPVRKREHPEDPGLRKLASAVGDLENQKEKS